MQTVISMLKDMSSRLARVEGKVGVSTGSAAPPAAPAAAASGAVHPRLAAYDAWMDAAMQPIDEAAAGLKAAGFPKAKQMGNYSRKAAVALRKVIEAGTVCEEPSPAEFQKFVSDLTAANKKKGKGLRAKKLSRNYEKQTGEMMDVANWPYQSKTVTGQGPHAYLKSSIGSVEYHSNRCRVEYKSGENKELHMKYCAGLKNYIETLAKYVLMNGMKEKFQWKYDGKPLSEFAGSAAAPAPVAAAAPVASAAAPAPAPKKTGKKGVPPADMGALFASLQKGGNVTKGLKHVSKSKMTHKNKALRAKAAVPFKTKAKKENSEESWACRLSMGKIHTCVGGRESA